jgi:hypothetical protein
MAHLIVSNKDISKIFLLYPTVSMEPQDRDLLLPGQNSQRLPTFQNFGVIIDQKSTNLPHL